MQLDLADCLCTASVTLDVFEGFPFGHQDIGAAILARFGLGTWSMAAGLGRFLASFPIVWEHPRKIWFGMPNSSGFGSCGKHSGRTIQRLQWDLDGCRCRQKRLKRCDRMPHQDPLESNPRQGYFLQQGKADRGPQGTFKVLRGSKVHRGPQAHLFSSLLSSPLISPLLCH